MSTNYKRNKKRSRRSGRKRQKKEDNNERKYELKEELETQFDEYINETPLILIELSNREWKQYKPYSIHFVGASIYNNSENKAERNNNVSYESYEFGTHLKKYKDEHMKKLECISNIDNEKLIIDELLIDRMKKMRLFLNHSENLIA